MQFLLSNFCKKKLKFCFSFLAKSAKWAEKSKTERRHPAGLEKRCLVSQAGTFFVTWLKMCPNTIPITLGCLLSPTWLPSLHHSPPSLENSLLFAQPIPSPRSSLFLWLLGDSLGPHLVRWGWWWWGGVQGQGWQRWCEGGCVDVYVWQHTSLCVCVCVGACICVWLRVRRDSAGTIVWGVTNPSLTIY